VVERRVHGKARAHLDIMPYKLENRALNGHFLGVSKVRNGEGKNPSIMLPGNVIFRGR
jgi:hypothetical protein